MRTVFRIALPVLLLASAASAAGDRWLLGDWPYRHIVEVVSPDESGEINTALAALDTAGRTREDGGDARVFEAESGKRVKHRVQSVEGDTLKVRFEVADPSVTRYHVYYGNPDAECPGYEWDERVGGLVVVTYENKLQQAARNLRHMRQLVEAAEVKIGEGPRRMINDVAIPFGEARDHFLSVYEGKLFLPEGGTYLFATNSDDSSFLLINGRLVAQRPGRNNPLEEFETRGRLAGEVELERGIHEIIYYHVKVTGDQLARAGWRPPWGRRIETIPEETFIRELRVESLGRESRDQAVNAFFTHEHTESVEFAGVERRFVTVDFQARVSSRFGEPVLWKWDFGDGTVLQAENPRHTYKEEGEYTVRLTVVDRFGYRDTCERRIAVKAQNPARVTFHLEAETENAVLKPGQAVRLQVKFNCTGDETWRGVLNTDVVADDGRLLHRAAECVQVTPRRWVTRPVSVQIGEPRASIRLSLRYQGETLASQTVPVIAPELIGDSLGESNGFFVNEDGEFVALRLSQRLDAPDRPPFAERLKSKERVVVCVVDDSLAPPGEVASEFSYYSMLRSELQKRYPGKEIVVERVGAEFVSHHDPLRRLGLAPSKVAKVDPDLVVLAASMRDLTNYVPAEQFEVTLYAMADRLRGSTDAEIVLVTAPPFVLNPSLSAAYAERAVRVGLMRGLKMIDVYSDFARLGVEGWEKLFQDPTEPHVLYLYPNVEGQERIARLILRSILR